jgi:hypothetical protein
LADIKNVKTLSTSIDEMPFKAELEDNDVFMVKGSGTITQKSSLLSVFAWLQNKLSNKLNEKLDVNLKGSAKGLAELDDTGKVPSIQLPSFVDNVLNGYFFEDSFFEDEEHTTALRPESGKIYINLEQDQNENKTYRWTGTTYVVISDTITLGETSSTSYRGDRGKIAYEHTLSSNGSNPHGTTKADVGLELVKNIATEDALISYEEPADPVEGEQEIIPETGSNLKTIVGWMMKKIRYNSGEQKVLSVGLNNLNKKFQIQTYSIQNGNLFEPLQLYYTKAGNLTHVYFSGKTKNDMPSRTIIMALGLPHAAIQQDFGAVAAYANSDVQITVNQETAALTVIPPFPANTWLRFCFSYITAE